MQSDDDISFHPHIEVEETHSQNLSFMKVLHALYPKELIQLKEKPNFKKIDTYVLFYLCPYDIDEVSLLNRSIKRAQELLKSNQLKLDAHILIVLYRDLKVAFPERKLQREKIMSENITKEILSRQAPLYQNRIHITHEFGTSNLKDTLQQLTGSFLYFEVGTKP